MSFSVLLEISIPLPFSWQNLNSGLFDLVLRSLMSLFGWIGSGVSAQSALAPQFFCRLALA